MNARRCAAALTAAALCGCGALDMGPDDNLPAFHSLRRVFVQDPARNDSLGGSLGHGTRFVLQPGLRYDFRVDPYVAGDRLEFFRYEGRLLRLNTLAAAEAGGAGVFTLETGGNAAAFFAGRLLPGPGAPSRRQSARLIPQSTSESAAISAHLIFVGRLTGLADDAAKAAFAEAFFSQLNQTFTPWNVTLGFSHAVVNGDGPPVAVEFGPLFHDLPGARPPHAVPLYLVDSIFIRGVTGGLILGFAPREAMDLNKDRESRVILNVRGGGATAMATTAAHELGHFLGLRHTTGTQLDLEADQDWSNRDDGFPSTEVCDRAGLAKAAASVEAIPAEAHSGRPYCLFISAPACPLECDLTNLMFPYDCSRGTASQRALTAEQQVFLRRSLWLFGPR